jgi:type II secretory pathway component PulF
VHVFRLPTPRAIWRSLPGRWASRVESAQAATLLAACRALDVTPAPLLEAWARDSRGRQGWRLVKAARSLQAGVPLAAVPDQVPGLLCDDHAVAVRFGGRTGLLAPVVRAAVAADTGVDAERRRRTKSLVRFATVWSILALLVTIFLATKIAPQFKKIVEDFDASLSPVTQRWIDTCSWAAGFTWLLVPLAVLGLVLRFSPAVRREFARPFTRRRRTAAALDTLAVAAAAGQPLHAAAAALAASQTDGRLAVRLGRAAIDGSAGKTLAAAGLLTAAEGRELDAAAGDPATLERIAARRRDALRRRSAAWQGAISLGLLAVAGAFVFWTALAILMPLIDWIEQLAGVRP